MRTFWCAFLFSLFLFFPTPANARSDTNATPKCLKGVLLSSAPVMERMGPLFRSAAQHNQAAFLFETNAAMDGALCGFFEGGACVPTKASTSKSRERERPKGTPPSEWQLLLFMALSGAIVSVVSSFSIQSLFEFLLITPSNNTAESRINASFAYTAANVALIPWVVAGTLFGLSRLSNNYDSNFWWMLLGAYAGQVLSAGIGLMTTLLGSGTQRFAVARIVTLIADGLLAATGAMLAYLFTRKAYEEVEHMGALFHLREGRVRMGIPLPLIYRDAYEQRISMTFLAGRF